MSFRVRNVIDVDYVKFLKTDKPEEAVLAILGNLGTDSPATAVQHILATLKQLTMGQLALGKFLRQLEVLSKLHLTYPSIWCLPYRRRANGLTTNDSQN